MSHEIQPYHEELIEPSVGGPQPRSPDGLAMVAHFFAVLRRRWVTALLVWVSLLCLSIPVIYLLKKPTCTATAHIQVLPVLPRVLYKDEDSQQMPLFESYLRTQAELAVSHQVLRAALTDPAVKDLPLLNHADPVSALRSAVTAEPVRGTQIVQIRVTQPVAGDAIKLTKAIVDAYLAWAEDEEKRSKDDNRSYLETEQSRLRTLILSKQQERNELAGEYATTNLRTYDSLRESIAKSGMQARDLLESAELEILQLKDQIRQIEDGVYVGLVEGSPSKQQQAIEDDPIVRSLRERLVVESTRLARLRSGMTDEAKEVIEAREQVRQLQVDLEKERMRATEDLARAGLTTQKRMRESLLAEKKARLLAAERHRDALLQRVTKQEAEAKRIGKTSVDIQTVQEEIDRYSKDLAVVEERIKLLTTESRRQARVSRASDPELRPGNISDERRKLSLGAALGSFVVALVVAFLRDRVEARVFAPPEVENNVGLTLLGVVPPLSGLRLGRISPQDLRECYRLIRVSLLSSTLSEAPPKSILVTSAQAGEGKTSTAVNLAASLAERSGRVLLIDGDVQAPQLQEVLDVSAPYGLEQVLLGERSLMDCVVRSEKGGMDVLFAGPNPGIARSLLEDASASHLIEEAENHYDYVVVDSPPALGAADALVWAQAVDGVVVCTFAGYSSVKVTQLACGRLQMVGAKLLGAVICNLSSRAYYSSISSRGGRDSSAGGVPRLDDTRALPFVHAPAGGQEKPRATVTAPDRPAKGDDVSVCGEDSTRRVS